MENQNYQEKLNKAKDILKVWVDTKDINNMPDVSAIVIEALEHLIWELENFLKQDADVSQAETTSDKVSAEILNNQEPH